MVLNVGQITLIDLIGQLERKEVIINSDYQRSAGVWPDSARSYFVDTILEGYPFPKIYLYQIFNERSRRPIKEIVDGQQRITTIKDFLENKFRLTSASKKYAGMAFNDLSEIDKQKFLSYQIDLSIILSATRGELLEMFRRINAYTAPLSAAEKRHATYQGSFKWFIVEQADTFSPILESLQIFTSKQLTRMADSEFIADLIIALERGIVEKSNPNIEKLYKKYDTLAEFEQSNLYGNILNDFFRVLMSELSPIHNTFMMKSYVVQSLFCAFVHSKYGLPNVSDLTDVVPSSNIMFDFETINAKLKLLADAHEMQEEDGPYGDYVKVCLSSTTKLAQRKKRFQILVKVFSI